MPSFTGHLRNSIIVRARGRGKTTEYLVGTKTAIPHARVPGGPASDNRPYAIYPELGIKGRPWGGVSRLPSRPNYFRKSVEQFRKTWVNGIIRRLTTIR